MKPTLQLRFPKTGHVYQVPASIVSEHRDRAGSDIPVESYALLAMTWEELQPHARLVEFNPPERVMTDATALLVGGNTSMSLEANGESLLQTPVEALIASQLAQDQIMGGYMIHDSNGKPLVFVSVVTSLPPVVETAADLFSKLQTTVVHMMAAHQDQAANAPSPIITQ